MKKKTKLLWLIPITVLMCAVVFVFVFWNDLSIYMTPKTVLTEAISQRAVQLQQRFAENPVKILYQGIDPEGKQTVDLDLSKEDPVWGQIRYDMQLQVQPNRVCGQGKAFNGQRDLDIAVYLDTQFMAISSEDLLQGSYYGIHYDTFSQDIRSIALLNWILGDSILKRWETSVQHIQKNMKNGVSYAMPQFPEITEAQQKALMLALRAAPAKVEKTTVSIQGQPMKCHRIAYSLKAEKILPILKTYIPLPDMDAVSVDAAFYLCEKALVLADITVTAGEEVYHVSAELGQNALEDPVRLDFDCGREGERLRIAVEATQYQESWHIQKNAQTPIHLSYAWTPGTGETTLIGEDGQSVSFLLTQTDNGFRIDAEDMTALYGILKGTQKSDSQPLKGSVTIQKGAEFTTPQYKNLDAWSLEDFLILLEGVGSLIGIQFPG